MNIFFLFQITALSSCLRQNLFRSRVKLLSGRLQIIRSLIILKRNLQTVSAVNILTGIPCLQPEQLRMIIVHRLEHTFKLLYRHLDGRGKSLPALFHGIGINLAVQLLHICFQHGIIGILLPVKTEPAACFSTFSASRQNIRFFRSYLLRILLNGLIAVSSGHRVRNHLWPGGRNLIACRVPALKPGCIDARPGIRRQPGSSAVWLASACSRTALSSRHSNTGEETSTSYAAWQTTPRTSCLNRSRCSAAQKPAQKIICRFLPVQHLRKSACQRRVHGTDYNSKTTCHDQSHDSKKDSSHYFQTSTSYLSFPISTGQNTPDTTSLSSKTATPHFPQYFSEIIIAKSTGNVKITLTGLHC